MRFSVARLAAEAADAVQRGKPDTVALKAGSVPATEDASAVQCAKSHP